MLIGPWERVAQFKKFYRGGSDAKSCILSCLLQFDNNKWGSPSSFLSHKHLKLKLRVFLAGHIVAMVTDCAIKLTTTCSPMIGLFFDTMMLVSTDTVLCKSNASDNR